MSAGDVLNGSPYLLDGPESEALLAEVQQMEDRVSLLRKSGRLNESVLEGLRREWNVEQVYESAGIEGNTLTLQETKLAIVRGITISGKPSEHTDEVVKLHEAHQYLEQLAKDHGSLTQRHVLDIHTLVLGQGVPSAGEYRKVEVAIGNQKHKPPHPLKVPERMQQYFAWLAGPGQDCPTPLLAAVAHAWLVHEHPFRDGNGRTARAVMNLLLMKAGFPVVIIRRKDRQRYYDALARSDEGDIGPVLELFLARAADSLRQIDRVRKAITGVSLEMERIAAMDERAVAVWNAAVSLLCEELAEAFQRVVQAGGRFVFDWRAFEPLEREDYHQLCERQSISQAWIARFSLSRGPTAFRFLLWAGYASDEMGPKARGKPALFLSEPNPAGYPQWRLPSSGFGTTVREIAYVEGKFLVRREGSQAQTEDSGTAFAHDLVREALRSVFVE